MPTTPGVVRAKRRNHATDDRASNVRGELISFTTPLSPNVIVSADGVTVA
jgi:hypothetical protein